MFLLYYMKEEACYLYWLNKYYIDEDQIMVLHL